MLHSGIRLRPPCQFLVRDQTCDHAVPRSLYLGRNIVPLNLRLRVTVTALSSSRYSDFWSTDVARSRSASETWMGTRGWSTSRRRASGRQYSEPRHARVSAQAVQDGSPVCRPDDGVASIRELRHF